MCGGTPVSFASFRLLTGLSPRVRGNLGAICGFPVAIGSIPACAGEPRCQGIPCWPAGVYPRVCGGTGPTVEYGVDVRGLSPRVRGNHSYFDDMPTESRSIPACAGEPSLSTAFPVLSSVYPRVCGGTSSTIDISDVGAGLSPRVRGNHHHH